MEASWLIFLKNFAKLVAGVLEYLGIRMKGADAIENDPSFISKGTVYTTTANSTNMLV